MACSAAARGYRGERVRPETPFGTGKVEGVGTRSMVERTARRAARLGKHQFCGVIPQN
jgi:hypothetical protein